MEVTQEDHLKYPYHTEGTIRCIKIILSMSSEDLKFILSDTEAHNKLRSQFGPGTNQNWMTGQVAKELYDRGVLDEHEFDVATR